MYLQYSEAKTLGAEQSVSITQSETVKVCRTDTVHVKMQTQHSEHFASLNGSHDVVRYNYPLMAITCIVASPTPQR